MAQSDGQPSPRKNCLNSCSRRSRAKSGQAALINQPIQMRFDEIMAGARAELSLKIFGDDYDTLERLANEAETLERFPARATWSSTRSGARHSCKSRLTAPRSNAMPRTPMT
jgi:Cu/Ag efflux pump CusA